MLGLSFRSGSAVSQQADAETINREGLALLRGEKFKEAVTLFEQAIKLKPDFAEAYYHLGEAYLELADKKAVEAFKRAISHKPDSALAYNKLGEAYSNERDYQKAIDAYTQSLRLDSTSPLTHYNLGVAYGASDKKQSALAEYRSLQTLNPDLAQDLYNEIYKPTVSVFADGTVRLSVIAIDAHGGPITDLKTQDLQVIDEGMSEAISLSAMGDIPTFYTIVIDTSGVFDRYCRLRSKLQRR
jgi:Putative Zn-dependent protease, contains TPR repeats